MAAAWNVVLPATVSALATLVGIILGVALGRRSNHRHWLQSERLAAYAELLRSYAEVEAWFKEAWRNNKYPQGIDWSRWNRSLNIVALVGGRKVTSAAADMDGEWWRLYDGAKAGAITVETWPKESASLAVARLQFINVARREFLATSEILMAVDRRLQ